MLSQKLLDQIYYVVCCRFQVNLETSNNVVANDFIYVDILIWLGVCTCVGKNQSDSLSIIK